ncbi:DUF294 nucleotidyltransferase-like domain-containing protein [Vibrio sinaloensis]|nr:DUF294 nucleotidyltransferase-like domain-containing protein [Vibrio sinaloensis]
MELISAVNEQIIEKKAFELIVPPALHDHCCLVVFRLRRAWGTDLKKTDQDNALIVKDGLQWHQCSKVMDQLTHTLQQLGYPLCPGNVMVNNPKWVKSQADWQKALTKWSKPTSAEQVMDLAIFLLMPTP